MESYERPELRESLLGEYGFLGLPIVYGQSHKRGKETYLTMTHECEHRRLTNVTSFGIVQRITAYFINLFKRFNRITDSTNCEKTLGLLIESSWYCHEGAATFKEYMDSYGLNIKFPFDCLPENYKSAFEKAERLSKIISAKSGSFLGVFTVTLIECAMNTRILEKIKPGDICNPDLFNFVINNTDENPDKRIEILIEELYNNKSLTNILETKVKEELDSIVTLHGKEYSVPIQAGSIDELYKLYVYDDLFLWQRCNFGIQKVVLSFLNEKVPNIVNYSYNSLEVIKRKFLQDVNKYLNELGLPTVEFVSDAADDQQINDPEWWMRFSQTYTTFGKDGTIYETSESSNLGESSNLEIILKSMALPSAWLNVHIMANSFNIDIPLSYDNEVLAKSNTTLFLLIPSILTYDNDVIKPLPHEFCYRDSFESLLSEIKKFKSSLITITTTDRSYDLKTESFRTPSFDFNLPPDKNFILYITVPHWRWLYKQWENLEVNSDSLLYLDPQDRMNLLITRKDENFYYFTALDNNLLPVLSRHNKDLFVKNMSKARDLSLNKIDNGQIIGAAITLYFFGVADKI